MIRLIKNLILLCVAGSIVAIGLGFFGALHPALDTFAHFRLHLGVCLLIAFCVLIFTRHKKIAITALLTSMIALYHSKDGTTWSAKRLPADGRQNVYSLLHLNLLWDHPNKTPVIDAILEQDPDLISLSEASSGWARHLQKLNTRWPHLFVCPEDGPRGGVRIYSKWPMSLENDYCGVYGTFGKTSVTTPSGAKIAVGSLHLRWPWPASGPRQLKALIPDLEKLETDALIAGDFNATTWSHTVTRFAEAGKLAIVPGIGSTWLFEEFPGNIAKYAGLPIDNVMHKGTVKVLSADRLPHVESDHFPILVRFQISK